MNALPWLLISLSIVHSFHVSDLTSPNKVTYQKMSPFFKSHTVFGFPDSSMSFPTTSISPFCIQSKPLNHRTLIVLPCVEKYPSCHMKVSSSDFVIDITPSAFNLFRRSSSSLVKVTSRPLIFISSPPISPFVRSPSVLLVPTVAL